MADVDKLAETRARVLTESLEISNDPKFGYFGFPGPLCIGDDSYAPRLMKKVPDGSEEGEPISNIKTSPCKKGMHPNVFFSFSPPLCIDDPYKDPTVMTKKGKVHMLDPDACFKPPGSVKKPPNKLGYEYVPHMDGVKDPKAVKEALDGVLPLRQIYTNAAKKGGGGVLTSGVLFGFGDERKFPEHVPDDYDSAKKQRKLELEHHQSKLQESSFKSMVYGNNNFSTNEESFGYDVPTHIPREPTDAKKELPHESDFKPANPMKKGMLKGLIGEFIAFSTEDSPDPQPGPAQRAAPVEGEAPLPFKLGCPVRVPKPTPSVTTLARNMRSERPSSFARPLL